MWSRAVIAILNELERKIGLTGFELDLHISSEDRAGESSASSIKQCDLHNSKVNDGPLKDATDVKR